MMKKKTINRNAYNIKRSENALIHQGYITLRSTQGMDSFVELEKASDNKKQSNLNISLSIKSNVNENLYIAFGGSNELVLQLGNRGFSILGTEKFITYDRDQILNISIINTETGVIFYINGEHVATKGGDTAALDSSIKIILRAYLNVDLEAVIFNASDVDNINPPSLLELEKQLGKKLKDSLNNNDVKEAYTLIMNYDNLDLNVFIDCFFLFFKDKADKNVLPADWFLGLILTRINKKNKAKINKILNKITKKPLLKINNLDVEFYKYPNKFMSLTRLFTKAYGERFLVLEDINFSLNEGDVLGVIGANGAGKSSLLRAIAGTIPKKRGDIKVFGKQLLISPGLGIKNELTGRENIILAAIFMGYSWKEAEKLSSQIIDFSGLEANIDLPFKYYSDGMKSRLIFSIATAVAPEILMLDELLNAGDVSFQEKAAQRMDEFINEAKGVIVVTHSIPFILEKCTKALLINNGKQVTYGDPQMVVNQYFNYLNLTEKSLGKGHSTVGQETNSSTSFLPSL